jgi:phage shock protein A
MDNQLLGKSGPRKNFWQRPEGVTGTLFLAAIVVGGGALLYKFLPYIITLLQNAIHAAILFAVLGVILYVLLDPKFRNLVWYMYKAVMRWFTGIFVQLNPISILETYIEHLYKNLKDMERNISTLKGQIAKLTRLIEDNVKEMKENMQIAEAAKQKGNMDLVAVNTRQYGRLDESNKRYADLLKKMDILYRVLSKIRTNSEYLIKDLENEVRMKKQERAAIRAGYSAMRHAMSIINGDTDKKMMFDMAMEAIIDDISMKVGEMERFLEVSASFIDSIDLQNGIYEQKGLELLEKMEKDGLSFLNDTKGMPIIANGSDDVKISDIARASDFDSKSQNDYRNLF